MKESKSVSKTWLGEQKIFNTQSQFRISLILKALFSVNQFSNQVKFQTNMIISIVKSSQVENKSLKK
ncbi:unnamed protein product [Diamesa tonsa]